MQQSFKEVTLSNWSDFVALIDDYPSWVFRGQASANWELVSTLDRHTPTSYPKHFAEFNLTADFRRRAHTFLQPQEIPQKHGEWLALMQHYGAPTRLLDFTKSPFVAAYFALEDLPADRCEVGVIWAIEPGWCQAHLAATAIRTGEIFGYERHALMAALEQATKEAPDSFVQPEARRGYGMMMLGSILAKMLDTHAHQHMAPCVGIFEPDRLSARLAAQQGLFLWPGDVSKTVAENLRAMPDLDRGVRKITLPISERGRALDYLRLANISRTTLFPGLEGFAQSFRTALVKEPVEERAKRKAERALNRAE